MKSGPKIFSTIENRQILFQQMMTFLNPLNVLTPKIPFSFFAGCWVRVTSGAGGSVSVGFRGPVN